MFYGQHRHSLDPKGRVIFPSKYREELGETFMLSVGTDKCISVYPMNEWDKLVERINSLPNSKTIGIKRYLFGRSIDVSMDKQGRVLIPEKLRELAGIDKDKEIVIAGISDIIEIWDAESYDKLFESDMMSADEIASEMELLGI